VKLVLAGSSPVSHPKKWKMPLNGGQTVLKIVERQRCRRGSIPPSSVLPPEAKIVPRTADITEGAVPSWLMAMQIA
jgi:hypothetical protein